MAVKETLVEATRCVSGGGHLSRSEASSAAAALVDAAVGDEERAEFLRALAVKGETAAEIEGFASEFRGRATDPGLQDWAPRAIDVVGTGGDHAGTFNVSTAAVFVVAAAGVPVIKHGNRSVTSSCGTADLLAAAGLPLEQDSAGHARALAELGFTFLFAPAFHPAFRAVGPVRKALAAEGRRTIFNLLGPLLNPARPAYQLVGVSVAPAQEAIASALGSLGVRSAAVVLSRPAGGRVVDELTVCGPCRVVGTGRLAGVVVDIAPAALGLEPAALEALRGGDAAVNLRILETVLGGRSAAPLEDTVVLNAGAALWVAGAAGDLAEGLSVARRVVRDGRAAAVLERTRRYARGA